MPRVGTRTGWISRNNPYSMVVAKDGYQPKTDRLQIVRAKTQAKNLALQEAGC
jgi:hypothetical protein